MALRLDELMTESVRTNFHHDVQVVNGLLSDDPQLGQWPIHPDSALAKDDLATAGYEPISHQVIRLVHASTDFLHGVSSMILEAKSVHTYAEYAMIRGGIECAAVAWWLLEPPSQRERVSRSLRVFWADTKDMGLVYQDASSWRRTKRQRLEWRNAVALANGIDSGTLDGGYNMTSVLTTMSTKMGSGVLTAWRVASGMTHGRSWAMLAMSAQEFGVAGDDNTIPVRISADLDSLGMIFHNAAVAMQDAYSMFHRRRAPTQRTALGLPLQ